MERCGGERKYRRDWWLRQFDDVVEGVIHSGERPLLLLHACCAPCTSGVLEHLVNAFRVVVFYYNPNIAPQTEYDRRLGELQRFLQVYPCAVHCGVMLKAESASYEEWERAVGLGNEPSLALEAERGERCRRCCSMRLMKTREVADKIGAQYFATTLTVSPHKDADAINESGIEAAESGGAKYLASDFKKRNGYLNSLHRSREYGLYRQQYCGCKCSIRNK